MVFNNTFNTISVISWWRKPEYPEKTTDLLQVTDKLYDIMLYQVPITTNVVSSNPTHGEVYLIQHYVIKFVSDLQQVSGFLWVLRFPPP
jgi:hypothetical protein